MTDGRAAAIARLVPLVRFAYAIQRGTVPLPERTERALPPTVPVCKGSAADIYVDGLKREIKENYSFPEAGWEVLKERALDGSLGPYTVADCHEAITILNAFLIEGLFLESRHGDCPQAVDELAKAFPGLPRSMCEEYIGLLGYVNR